MRYHAGLSRAAAGLGISRACKPFLAVASVISVVVTALAAQADCAQTPEVRIQEWPGDIYNIVPWTAEHLDCSAMSPFHTIRWFGELEGFEQAA